MDLILNLLLLDMSQRHGNGTITNRCRLDMLSLNHGLNINRLLLLLRPQNDLEGSECLVNTNCLTNRDSDALTSNVGDNHV